MTEPSKLQIIEIEGPWNKQSEKKLEKNQPKKRRKKKTKQTCGAHRVGAAALAASRPFQPPAAMAAPAGALA